MGIYLHLLYSSDMFQKTNSKKKYTPWYAKISHKDCVE